MKTDDRITAILARLREGVVGIYAQRKLDKLDEETGIQDWEEFVQEIKTTFSDKMNVKNERSRLNIFYFFFLILFSF